MIKFDGNGAIGSMDSIEMTYDETKALPANAFSFSGRTYAGWDTEANGSGTHYDNQAEVKNLTTEDNGIVTLYAQWSINPFFINYDGNGATSGEMATTNCEYDQSCILRENAFKKTGYHFIGWKYNNNDYTDKADVTNIIESGTITMVAQWAVNHYTIVFNINTDDANASGTMADMANLEYGTEYSLTANAFTRTGYNFDGWSTEVDGHSYSLTDAQLFRNLTTVDNDIVTLYAQWAPIHYNIVFHQNHDGVAGSTNSMMNVAYDETRVLSQNGFALEHYKYMGWNTAADGTGTPYEDGASIKNLTTTDGATIDLYAQWKERTAMLDTGANINKIMREQFTDAITFSHYTAGEPDFETITNEVDIALPTSNFPVYAWVDNGNLYWWSEADKPTMNVNSANFFNGVHNAGTASAPNNVANSLSKLESIDMTGLDASAAKDMTRLFANTKALNSLNLSDFDSSSATNMDGMFYGTALKNVDLSLIEAGNVTSMASMFQSTKFDALDFSNFDTHNVKLMSNMFTSAVMTNLDLSTLDTSSVTNMANMFKSSNITTLTFFDTENPTATKFDTSKVTTISEMFRESKTKTLDLSQFNTSAVTNMYGVFYSAAVSDLNVSNWDTSNVTSMYIMFFAAANLTSLNLSHFNTAKVTNMQQMFDSTTKLKYLNVSNWSNDKVTNMSYMFQDVGRGTAGEVTIVFDGFKTPSVTNMTRMFARYNDHNLKVLDLSSFDTSKVTSMGTMFGGGRQDTMIHNAMFDTIYVSDKFTNAGVSPTTEVFNRTSTAIGGAGTTWSQDHMTADYARIDDPDNGEPGYFTLKDSIYVRYHDNDGDAANDEANYALMPSYYVSTTGANTLRTNMFVRDHYKFMGWAKTADGEVVYADGATISEEASKTPLELYAVWKERTAILDTGPNVNAVLRSFAEEPQSFSHFNGTPDFEAIQNEQNIALTSSNFPVYAWYDETDQAIYWWSEAERPQLNTASAKLFSGTHTENNASVNNSLQNLKSIDLTGLDASNALYMDSMFANTTSLESLNLDDFDSSSAVNMASMFYGTNLASIDLSQIESQNVTDMGYMFSNSKFGSIDASKLNTQSVTKMPGMFRNAAATTIKFFDDDPTDSLFDTSKVTEMASMFYGVHVEELDLRNFNTEQVLNFNSMFLYADPIKKLDVTSFNTSNATNMGYMFDQLKNLEELDVTGFNTSKVTNMSNMFNSCAKLTELDVTNFDTSKVTIMDGMFAGLKNMEVLDLSSFNTGKVTTMYYYFVETNKLKTVYVSDLWSTDALSSHGGTFFQSQSTITGGAGTRMAQNSTSDIYARIDDPDNNGEKGMFTYKNARYIRYNGNGADNATPYGTMTSEYLKAGDSLKKNAFTRDGYVFTGWKDADNNEYADEQVMADLTESKTPLELYAQWRKNTAITTKRYRLMNADGSYPDEYTIESSEEMPMAIAMSQTYSKSVEGYQTQSTDSYTTIGEDIVYSLDLPRNQYSLTIQINDEYLMFNDMDHYFDSSITIDDIYWGQTVNLGNYVLITTMDFECLQYHDCKFKEWSQTTGTEGIFSDTGNINSTFTMGKEDATIYGDGELVEETYSLVYDANGGTGAPDTQVYPGPIAARYVSAVSFDISNQIPTRDGYGFWGWGDSATTENPVVDNSDARVDGYGSGDEFHITQPTTTLYAIWKPVSGNLQGWNGCADMTIGMPIYLLDTRDGQAYEVNKYKMNVEGTETACFMSNLNLGAWELTGDLTSENTNLTAPITIDGDNDGVSDWLDWDKTKESAYGRNSYTEPRFEFQSYLAEKPYNAYGDKYGVAYNFAFATANTFNHENTWGAIDGEITADICPSGWSMPTGGADGEYAKLVTAYGGLASEMNLETSPTSEEMALILQRDLGFSMAGAFYDGGYYRPEKIYGVYWTKTNPMDWVNMTTLGMKFVHSTNESIDIVNPDFRFKRDYGASIRCIAR